MGQLGGRRGIIFIIWPIQIILVQFILNFKSSSASQQARQGIWLILIATTFAFSSVFILLQGLGNLWNEVPGNHNNSPPPPSSYCVYRMKRVFTISLRAKNLFISPYPQCTVLDIIHVCIIYICKIQMYFGDGSMVILGFFQVSCFRRIVFLQIDHCLFVYFNIRHSVREGKAPPSFPLVINWDDFLNSRAPVGSIGNCTVIRLIYSTVHVHSYYTHFKGTVSRDFWPIFFH